MFLPFLLVSQVRPGLNGKPFELMKFRSMRDATGPDGQPLPDAERQAHAPMLAILSARHETQYSRLFRS